MPQIDDSGAFRREVGEEPLRRALRQLQREKRSRPNRRAEMLRATGGDNRERPDEKRHELNNPEAHGRVVPSRRFEEVTPAERFAAENDPGIRGENPGAPDRKRLPEGKPALHGVHDDQLYRER